MNRTQIVVVASLVLSAFSATRGLPPAAIKEQPEPKFLQALQPREWSFPKDHGRHDGFKTEWWYFTGNLRERATGRRFGYQLTFFRSSFVPTATTRPSPWAMTDLYFAHAAISDVEGNRLNYADRLSRGREKLAMASDKSLDVVLKDWSVKSTDGGWKISATQPATQQAPAFALDLSVSPGHGPILQGPGGVNPKGVKPGQASYYYSMTRLPTAGTLTLDGKAYDVAGHSWFDHEFASNSLGDNQSGWDWFAINLADGSDLMLYRLRDKAGKTDYLSGTQIDAKGDATYLTAADIELTPSKPWKSPASGAAYPQRWTVRVKGGPAMTVQTRFDNQELQTPNSTDVTYYEGAAKVEDANGAEIGEAYIEMTGYAGAVPK
jgi:predicted secreted hydrolase